MKEYLIICPNDTKKYILEEINKQKKLVNINFMTIKQFMDNYFYSYDNQAVAYLMNKYKINIDISKMYLNNLYSINIDKNYNSEKLKYLKELKKELIEEDLLTFNTNFKNYLKNKKIKVINYPKLEKYLLEELKKLEADFEPVLKKEKEFVVYECQDMYDEIYFLFEKIISLFKAGVPLNKMFVVNMNSDYNYTIEYILEMIKIPILVENKNSIISTSLVKKYLVTGILPEINTINEDLVNQIIDVKNSLVDLEEDVNYEIFLKDKLKNTYIASKKYKNTIKCVDLFEHPFKDDEYVFLLGFNDSSMPLKYKDEEYLTDKEKKEGNLYTSLEKNIREKDVTLNYLSNIKNLTISYKLSSFKDNFYPSSMISDINMQVIKYSINNYDLSNKFNMRQLSVYLDRYYKYREEYKYLKKLKKTYSNTLTYNTYKNDFTGLDLTFFKKHINQITLSYTSMNSYNLCPFKYYVNYILKVDSFKEEFSTFIGNLYHYVLERCFEDDFVFLDVFNEYLRNREMSFRDQYLLERLKSILENVIKVIKDQSMYTSLKKHFYEKEIVIPLKNNNYFKGKIDKVMYKEDDVNTIFALIDYKTGFFEANLYNMKYGINMQLATYLYLIQQSNIFHNGKFGGMYFQKVLMPTTKMDLKKNYLDKLNENMKLVGFSTNDEEILKEVDHNYTNSTIIKGMKVKKDGTFPASCKILSEDDINNIVKYTNQVIDVTLQKILKASFSISPKKIGNNDISCQFCKYKDLCFKKEDNYKKLIAQKDLSFLEGDYNGE